jgi:hypothetical protein
MARNNLAYKLQEPARRYDAEPVALPRPRLRAIEGQGRASATQPQAAPWLSTLVVMSAIVVIVLATVAVGRVSIANATVQMMQASEQTRSAIDRARAVGLELEVQHSLANNPTRIQDNAAALGVLPAAQPETIPALSGFTPATREQMQNAVKEAQAAAVAEAAPPTEAAEAAEAAPPADAAETAAQDETAASFETALSVEAAQPTAESLSYGR